MEILEQIAAELIAGEDENVEKLTREAVDQSIPPDEILAAGLLPGMDEVGRRFREHEVFLPDVLLAARAMKAAMALIKPLLSEGESAHKRGKIVIGTVKGDMHDIGKNLVGALLVGAGFEVIDLGVDIAPAQFISTARENDASLIAMSALLTTTMPVMKEVVTLLETEGLAKSMHTVVGGAPVTAEFAEEIGADGYAYDAASAVEVFSGLVC